MTHSQRHTLDEQINRCAPAEFRGEAVATTISSARLRSGATLHRPHSNACSRRALGDYDCILITSPERWLAPLTKFLLRNSSAPAALEFSLSRRRTRRSPPLQLRGAVADTARTIVDRMRRGRLARYRAGLLLPWTRPVYGYLLDPERPRDPKGVRVSEPQAAVVRQIFAWYLEEGASLSSIVNRLFEHGIASPGGRPRWRHTTVRFMLRNPAYTGTLYACRSRARRSLVRRSALQPVGKRHNDSAAPARARSGWRPARCRPLVMQEQYELVQEKLQRTAIRGAQQHGHDYCFAP